MGRLDVLKAPSVSVSLSRTDSAVSAAITVPPRRHKVNTAVAHPEEGFAVQNFSYKVANVSMRGRHGAGHR